MQVFGTEIHIVTFLITLFELVFFFYQIIYYLSRPSDKNRLYYLILLYLLIQYNLISGLLPDENIPIPLLLQNILAFSVALVMAMYFPFYFYKAFNLVKLKFYAFWGSLTFLFIPFILFFLLPYYITGDLELSRRLVVIVPFFYALSFLFSLSKAIKVKYKEYKEGSDRKEIIGVYIGVIFWISLPIIAFFETNLNLMLKPILNFHNGSQVVEVVCTNLGLLIMTILFIRQSVKQSRDEYNKLLSSERILQDLNASLTRKVKERTKELELANEKLTNTVINLAHETKTPLTLINNYLEEYINKYGETEELRIIKFSTEKLNKDIINFFDLERIKKGFYVYNHEQISDMSNMLKGNIELFKRYALKKNIEIKDEVEDGLIIKADPESVYRIINNIIENAIKYTEENGRIEISLKESNEKIKFSVKDNGIGIKPEFQKKIFDPYYQIKIQKQNFQGMGVGLSIVKKITDSINAIIVVESDPKIKPGTEVSILFRRQKSLIIKDAIVATESIKGSFDIEKLEAMDEVYEDSRPTIMLVEDNIPLLNYMTKKLKEKYNIYIAKNGSEALDKIKTVKKLDLIISDVMMDKVNGINFYKSICQDERLSHIPFIFLTAKSSPKDRVEGLALGAIDYIYKPFLLSELTTKIDSVLKNLFNQRKAIINQAYNTLLSEKAFVNNSISIPSKFVENCSRYNLTSREIDIVKLIAKGQTYKTIGEGLNISDKTVAKHIQNIFEKVIVNNKLELINKLELKVD